ncbi:MAG: hypothetical protein SGJ26_05105, partial [Nitrospirota bacterium]|nr:hypothetical protein [Nitrospirota bacterium]
QPRRAKTRRSAGKAAASEEARRYGPHFVGPFARAIDLGERKSPSSASDFLKILVEPLSDARTPLADFFSILLSTRRERPIRVTMASTTGLPTRMSQNRILGKILTTPSARDRDSTVERTHFSRSLSVAAMGDGSRSSLLSHSSRFGSKGRKLRGLVRNVPTSQPKALDGMPTPCRSFAPTSTHASVAAKAAARLQQSKAMGYSAKEIKESTLVRDTPPHIGG